MTPETAQLIRPGEGVVYAFDKSWVATPNNVARSRRALLASLRSEGLDDEQVLEAIGEAVTEATTNTVYHAYVGRRIGQFQVTATIRPEAIEIRVADDGSGFEERPAPVTGRGLARIAAVVARLETDSVRDSGTRTTMWFDRAR